MTLLKAPKLEQKHLLALKVLVRLDYARAVRFKLEALKANPEETVDSTVKLQMLTDMLSSACEPLSITLALLEMHGAKEAQIPLTEERFSFFIRTLSHDVTDADFDNIPPDPLRVSLSALRDLKDEVMQRFTEAEALDPQGLLSHDHESAPAGKMMN